jgi:hypothetical protein
MGSPTCAGSSTCEGPTCSGSTCAGATCDASCENKCIIPWVGPLLLFPED